MYAIKERSMTISLLLEQTQTKTWKLLTNRSTCFFIYDGDKLKNIIFILNKIILIIFQFIPKITGYMKSHSSYLTDFFTNDFIF